MLPLALALILGLLLGFAAGYATGGRGEQPSPVIALAPGAASTPSGSAAATRPPTAPRHRRRRAANTASRRWGQSRAAAPTSGGGVPPVPGDAPSSAPAATPATAAPARAASPRATTGRLVIRSTPPGAAVTVNGKWRGRTPLTIDALQFGPYAVRLVRPGYTVAREDVTLNANDPARTLSIGLERERSAIPTTARGGNSPRPETGDSAAAAARRPAATASRFAGHYLRRFEPTRSAGLDRRASHGHDACQHSRHRHRFARGQARAYRSPRVDHGHARVRGTTDPRDRFARTHTMKAILALENGSLVRRGSGWSDRRDRRRGGLQHQHDRLSGNPHRPVVLRTDRHDDVPGDRQLRRRTRGRRVARAAGGRASSSARSRRSRATGASDGTLRDYLVAQRRSSAISDIDTRALTRVLRSARRDARRHRDRRRRSAGARREGASLDAELEGSDLVLGVTCDAPFDWHAERVRRVHAAEPNGSTGRPLRVAAYDFGMKWNILRRFTRYGCDVRVFPATAPASDLLASNPDGVFLSNGPGDPARIELRHGQRPRPREGGRAGLRDLSRPPDPVARDGRRPPTS